MMFEGVKGIEPSSSLWKSDIVPINYTPVERDNVKPSLNQAQHFAAVEHPDLGLSQIAAIKALHSYCRLDELPLWVALVRIGGLEPPVSRSQAARDANFAISCYFTLPKISFNSANLFNAIGLFGFRTKSFSIFLILFFSYLCSVAYLLVPDDFFLLAISGRSWIRTNEPYDC